MCEYISLCVCLHVCVCVSVCVCVCVHTCCYVHTRYFLRSHLLVFAAAKLLFSFLHFSNSPHLPSFFCRSWGACFDGAKKVGCICTPSSHRSWAFFYRLHDLHLQVLPFHHLQIQNTPTRAIFLPKAWKQALLLPSLHVHVSMNYSYCYTYCYTIILLVIKIPRYVIAMARYCTMTKNASYCPALLTTASYLVRISFNWKLLWRVLLFSGHPYIGLAVA